MEKRSLGLFLILIGIIFLIIALMTFWSVSRDVTEGKGYYLIFSIPLIVFSIYTIYFGAYLILKERLNQKVKGLFLIIDGLIPIIISIYVLLDERLRSLGFVRNLVLFPLFLVGFFLMIYGFFLTYSEKLSSRGALKSKVSRILGLISTVIGLINTIFFIVIVSLYPDEPIFFVASLLLVGAILIIFGVHLIIEGRKSQK
ncbi:MAG: hypothetical protein ACFFA6_11025 [Promethearchaeota archaeon]